MAERRSHYDGIWYVPSLLVLLLGSGCRLLDRESYSLAVRKPAHCYRDLTPAEKASVEASHRALPAMAPYENPLPPPETDVSKEDPAPGSLLEPFKPFAYCFTHRTAHMLESLVAVAVVPAEYPLALVTDTSAEVVTGAARWMEGIWRLLFPSRPTEEEPRDDPETKR